MKITPRTIFLMDGFGAIVSATLLGVYLVKQEAIFGMPSSILYPLAITACLLSVYSMLNYAFFSDSWRIRLTLIALLNILYCITTGLLVYTHQESLTTLGNVYFIVEILIILSLSFAEIRTSNQ